MSIASVLIKLHLNNANNLTQKITVQEAEALILEAYHAGINSLAAGAAAFEPARTYLGGESANARRN